MYYTGALFRNALCRPKLVANNVIFQHDYQSYTWEYEGIKIMISLTAVVSSQLHWNFIEFLYVLGISRL